MSKKKSTAAKKDLLDQATKVKEETATHVTNPSAVSLSEYSKNAPFSFSKANYRLLLIGLAINVLGFLLMIGGATANPEVFVKEELFSATRITIAPMLIVLGYIVILYAIMKRPKSENTSTEG